MATAMRPEREKILAGELYARDVPDGVFAAGNPCRVVRELTEWRGAAALT